MLNVTVVERDHWTRRALGRLLAQADLSVTIHESLCQMHARNADVIVAGASSITNQPTSCVTGLPPLVLIEDEQPVAVPPSENWRTVAKPIRVADLLAAIDSAAQRG